MKKHRGLKLSLVRDVAVNNGLTYLLNVGRVYMYFEKLKVLSTRKLGQHSECIVKILSRKNRMLKKKKTFPV